jgi:ribosomal protein S27AE
MSYEIEPLMTETNKKETASSATEREIVLGCARTLAVFAGLEPSGVDDFRECHKGFVPRVWWEYRVDSGELLWRLNQEFLREAWDEQFNIGQFELMRLLLSVFDPTWTFDVMFRTKDRPPFATLSDMPEEFYPYQQAVLFLMEDKWRAQICARCETRFIARHNRRQYCYTVWNAAGETCTILARREDHKRDHKKHREERNRKKRGAYARRLDPSNPVSSRVDKSSRSLRDRTQHR